MSNSTKLEELKAKQSELVSKLRLDMNDKAYNLYKSEIGKIQAEIRTEKMKIKLAAVNRDQTKIRETAKLVWECEEPKEEITSLDGSFHKTKVRRYPNLAALQYAQYVRCQWKDDRLTEIKVDGQTFRMYLVKYEYGKPTEYTRFESFEAFMDFNGILPKELTFQEYEQAIGANEKINTELKAAIAKADNDLKKAGVKSLNYFGLFSQSNEHLYTYSPNI